MVSTNLKINLLLETLNSKCMIYNFITRVVCCLVGTILTYTLDIHILQFDTTKQKLCDMNETKTLQNTMKI